MNIQKGQVLKNLSFFTLRLNYSVIISFFCHSRAGGNDRLYYPKPLKNNKYLNHLIYLYPCIFTKIIIKYLYMIEELKDTLNKQGALTLSFKINPGNSKNEIKDIMADGTIKINITAPPEKGKANKELIKFLSQEFAIDKRNITILSGETAQLKLIKIIK